ncbi:MAG: histone deacetylase family protein [Candidatus Thermoplasmatota archaeon]|nr:histone deacetylase family protein [Candidatus Thermoplasmatota archaeon]
MKIIYHPKFKDPSYASDPAAEEGRIECITKELQKDRSLAFSKPPAAEQEEIERVHTPDHLEELKKRSEKKYDLAALSAGGALAAAVSAYKGNPSFAVIRPPGHHASPDSCWGFCYLNNMAIAIENLKEKEKIRSAFVLDFDLHTGDGNINCLGGRPNVTIMNPRSSDSTRYLKEVRDRFQEEKKYDIVGVSAGFDEHVEDWGGKLKTKDYRKIGGMVKDFSKEKCEGRRFALLEGGYNHDVLGKNVKAFIEGFRA